ncbi:MAG: hypothetical protein J5I94_16610 [Phaeodactylibacter sp.]|nr:hypothetical protein [Phaeodactylibacter sp.]
MKSPFKFLNPYTIEDQDIFFGREEEVDELYELATKNRLIFVYGPSGTGKTSLVQCGLASRFDGIDWLPVFVRRGNDINASLRRELLRPLGGEEAFQGSNTEAIEALFNRYLRPVYLIFDQFEELFILGGTEEAPERQAFYESIAGIVDAELPCRVMFVMREDYFGHLNRFEKVIPQLYHNKLRVEPMNRENLHRVITGSCHAFHIGFGNIDNDVESILDNISNTKGGVQMPYVQVYLHTLYEEAYRREYEGQPQAESPRPVTFNAEVISGVGPIEDVLGYFLKGQEAEIQEKLQKRHKQIPDNFTMQALDLFVTEQGTKAPLSYQVEKDGAITLATGDYTRLKGMKPSWISDCLKELERSRILRQTEDSFELAHDTLAALIDTNRTEEQRQLNQARIRIQSNYREFQESGEHLSRKQLNSIEEYLPKLQLSEPVLGFIRESTRVAEHKERGERRRRRWTIAAVLLFAATMAIAALVSNQFRIKADEALLEAQDARVSAEEARRVAEERLESLKQQVLQTAKSEYNASLEKARQLRERELLKEAVGELEAAIKVVETFENDTLAREIDDYGAGARAELAAIREQLPLLDTYQKAIENGEALERKNEYQAALAQYRIALRTGINNSRVQTLINKLKEDGYNYYLNNAQRNYDFGPNSPVGYQNALEFLEKAEAMHPLDDRGRQLKRDCESKIQTR